jgi:hypothetical protein
VDLDRDGYPDLLTGSDPGEVHLFRGRADGGLHASEPLCDLTGEVLDVGRTTVARAVDWDADGDHDLIIGDGRGHVWFVENASGGAPLSFGTVTRVEAAGDPIRIPGGSAAPWIADWDGDGRADLVVGGGEGGVRLYRDLGKAGLPRLEAAVLLTAPIEGTRRSKPCVVDWNGDGRLDLLVGAACSEREEARPLPEAESRTWRQLEARLAWIHEHLTPIEEKLAHAVREELGIDDSDAWWYRRLGKGERDRYHRRVGEAVERDVGAAALKRMLEAVEGKLCSYLPTTTVGGHVWVYLRR